MPEGEHRKGECSSKGGEKDDEILKKKKALRDSRDQCRPSGEETDLEGSRGAQDSSKEKTKQTGGLSLLNRGDRGKQWQTQQRKEKVTLHLSSERKKR